MEEGSVCRRRGGLEGKLEGGQHKTPGGLGGGMYSIGVECNLSRSWRLDYMPCRVMRTRDGLVPGQYGGVGGGYQWDDRDRHYYEA